MKRTRLGGTDTREGWIEHFRHPSGVTFCVKTCFCGNHKLPHPVRRHGKLVYSYPGGGEFIPDTDGDIRRAMFNRHG